MTDVYEVIGKYASYNDYNKITDYDESYRKMIQLNSSRKVIVPGELKYWNSHIVPSMSAPNCEFMKDRKKPVPEMSKSKDFSNKDNNNCYRNYK